MFTIYKICKRKLDSTYHFSSLKKDLLHQYWNIQSDAPCLHKSEKKTQEVNILAQH